MLAAAARPSAIAHTIRDCPRPASPATKTPSSSVPKLSILAKLLCESNAISISETAGSTSGPLKPRANSTKSASITRSVPGVGTRLPSTKDVSAILIPETFPSLPMNSTVDDRYFRSPNSS